MHIRKTEARKNERETAEKATPATRAQNGLERNIKGGKKERTCCDMPVHTASVRYRGPKRPSAGPACLEQVLLAPQRRRERLDREDPWPKRHMVGVGGPCNTVIYTHAYHVWYLYVSLQGEKKKTLQATSGDRSPWSFFLAKKKLYNPRLSLYLNLSALRRSLVVDGDPNGLWCGHGTTFSAPSMLARTITTCHVSLFLSLSPFQPPPLSLMCHSSLLRSLRPSLCLAIVTHRHCVCLQSGKSQQVILPGGELKLVSVCMHVQYVAGVPFREIPLISLSFFFFFLICFFLLSIAAST